MTALFVEPDAGNTPVISAIEHATRSIAILIFRVDGHALTRALEAAVRRGVSVHALIAHKHHGGSKDLRKLESRLLNAGAEVSRTARDLVRYHGKMMVIDGRVLHLYGFNCTRLDLKSRSFGVTTTNRSLVREAVELFTADVTRRPYRARRTGQLVVSPDNARQRLSSLLCGARKQLLIYDPRLSDPALEALLAARVNEGVDVRVIGTIAGSARIPVRPYAGTRLHVRAIIRDGREAFIGSQSLGRVELDERREVGLLTRAPAVVSAMHRVFEQDWRVAG
jgi:phosphatidylserine/phosphatidylglycerophosphate/cardiolipin synthase-like enzyme